jgi:isopentenyl phosphate kinase
MRHELVLVKLGGSLITNKKVEGEARPATVERLAAEIAAWRSESPGRLLVLGHGSGSFGHAAAAKYGLGDGLRGGDPMGAAITQDQAARLHRLVVEKLLEAGLPAFSWAASTGLLCHAGRVRRSFFGSLLQALAAGLLPVFFGDVVADEALGAGIASTEAISLAFARAAARRHDLGISRAVWLGETEGIYDARGVTIPQIDGRNLETARRSAAGSAGVDVTGGMDLRLRTAWELTRFGVESLILDGNVPGRLQAALAGEEVPGTRVVRLAKSSR